MRPLTFQPVPFEKVGAGQDGDAKLLQDFGVLRRWIIPGQGLLIRRRSSPDLVELERLMRMRLEPFQEFPDFHRVGQERPVRITT